MKRIMIAFLMLSILFVVGCSANIHTVGNGPQKNEVIEARQWYVLYGLVPLNEVDTQEMAGKAADYEIKTEQTFLDIVINAFTGYVTVTSRTVTVKK